jgi:hypothetical protein
MARQIGQAGSALIGHILATRIKLTIPLHYPSPIAPSPGFLGHAPEGTKDERIGDSQAKISQINAEFASW